MTIPIEISARHVHLSVKDMEKVFGRGKRLTQKIAISQIGQFVSCERVMLKGPKGEFKRVGIVGPERKETQVELAETDARTLGVKAPVKESGKLAGTPGLTVTGPKGSVRLKRGAIIAKRHIHASTQDATKHGLRNGQIVSVKVRGKRPVTFHNVVVRVHETFRWVMHLDTDEGNAAGLTGKEKGNVLI